VSWAERELKDGRARFLLSDAARLPYGPFDAVVSGLVLDAVPDAAAAVAAMRASASRDGLIAAYVWDYDSVELMRYFWEAAADLYPEAAGRAGSACPRPGPEGLGGLWREAGLAEVSSTTIDIETVFADFSDYWRPFLGGQGPAPAYCMSLDETRRAALREHLRKKLPVASDGSIPLTARAQAVSGRMNGASRPQAS
jgi:hypothetical protein